MTANETTTLRALIVACRNSPDSWVEAWEVEPFLPITVHVTRDKPWWSDAVTRSGRFRFHGGTPRRFTGAYTAWRWREGQQVTGTLTHLKRKGLVETLPLLKATRTGNLLYVGRRVWRPTRTEAR